MTGCFVCGDPGERIGERIVCERHQYRRDDDPWTHFCKKMVRYLAAEQIREGGE